VAGRGTAATALLTRQGIPRTVHSPLGQRKRLRVVIQPIH